MNDFVDHYFTSTEDYPQLALHTILPWGTLYQGYVAERLFNILTPECKPLAGYVIGLDKGCWDVPSILEGMEDQEEVSLQDLLRLTEHHRWKAEHLKNFGNEVVVLAEITRPREMFDRGDILSDEETCQLGPGAIDSPHEITGSGCPFLLHRMSSSKPPHRCARSGDLITIEGRPQRTKQCIEDTISNASDYPTRYYMLFWWASNSSDCVLGRFKVQKRQLHVLAHFHQTFQALDKSEAPEGTRQLYFEKAWGFWKF